MCECAPKPTNCLKKTPKGDIFDSLRRTTKKKQEIDQIGLGQSSAMVS